MSVLKKFNPYDLPDALVRVIATGRDAVLGEIVDTITANVDAPILQHLLIAAPRGFGKSFLLRLLQIQLQERAAEGLLVRFVVLPEEQPNVTAPHLLLDEICRVLEGRPAADVVASWFDEEDTAWDQSLERLRRALEACEAGMKGLVVVAVENFDQLMTTVFREDEDASRLRKLLASEGDRLMLLATAADRVDSAYAGRLFHAFRTIELRPWEEDQCLTFFGRLRKELSHRELDHLERPKALAVAQFIGGSPRMATILYDVLQTRDSMQAIGLLDGLVDELTPYYKHRIESLSPRARALLDTLLRMGEPRSQSEVAAKLGTTQNRVAQSFAELLGQQVLIGERSARSRETLYRVTDRLMVHYYRKRILLHGTGGSPLEAITEFLEGFFTAEEKQAEAERLRGLGLEREAALFDGMLLRSRDAAALPAALDPTQLNDALTQAMTHIEAGQDAVGVEVALAAQQRAASEGDQKGELAAMLTVVTGLLGVDSERAIYVARKAISFAETLNDLRPLAAARFMLGLALTAANRPEDAVGWLRLARADMHGEVAQDFLLACGKYLGQVLNDLKNWDEAVSVWREVEELAARQKNKTERLAGLFGLQSALTLQGKYADATHARQTLSKIAEELGDQKALAVTAIVSVQSAVRRGRFQEATRWAEEAFRRATKLGDPFLITIATLSLGLAWIGTGRTRDAVALLRPILQEPPGKLDSRLGMVANKIIPVFVDVIITREIENASMLMEEIGQIRTEGDHTSQAAALSALSTGNRRVGNFNRSLDALMHTINLLNVTGAESLDGPHVQAALENGAYSAVRTGRWPELWRQLPGCLSVPDLSNRLSASIAAAITDEAHEHGRAKAFAIVTTIIDCLTEELTSEASIQPRLDARAVLRRAVADLAGRLQDAGLLRDIVAQLAQVLPSETAAEQALLEAAALHIEGGGADIALERVDPDIAAAIKRTRVKRRQ